jgi:K+-sensing histidine kinase KdpD
MSILEKIYEASLKFLAGKTKDEVISTIVDEAIKLVDAYSAGVYLKKDDKFTIAYASKPYMYKIVPRKNANTYKAFTLRKTIIADIGDVGKAHPEVKREGIKSSIFIPLSYETEAIGVLTLDSKKRKAFTEESKRILLLFGSFASLEINKAELYAQTKEAADTRDLFISLAAHELRTPMTTMNGYIQLILAKLRDKKKVDTKWIYELAFEANRLKLLVDEFLEINRVRTGKVQYDLRQISLSETIKRAVSAFSFTKPDRKIVLINKINSKKDKIVGDMDRLIQVFTNILENADKYSPEDKEIVIKTNNKTFFFAVDITDKGQGIERKDLPSIFKGFYKGKHSLHEGMGLGLYLAKRIIDAHKGEIYIKSKVGKGTKITIKLPKIEEK